jgi:hypothetical protein
VAHVFNSGDVLAASDLNTNMIQPNTAGTGVRIAAGRTTYSWSGSVSVQNVTVNYGVTFNTVTAVFVTNQNPNNIDVLCTPQSPTTSSMVVRITVSVGGGNPPAVGSQNLNWLIIGT